MAALAERAVLHIGTQKTGTSALQTWLARNRPLIAGAGMLYPLSCKWLHDDSHNGLAAAMLRDQRLAEGGHTARLLSELADEIDSQPGLNLILSSEMLEKAPRFAPDALMKLLDVLRGRFRFIEVVYCLRPPSELVDSIFRQWVQDHGTRFAGDPLALAEAELPQLDFSAIARAWLETGRIARIRGFWYEGHAPDAHLRRSLRLLGLRTAQEWRAQAHADWQNPSLDGRLLQIKHALNPHLADPVIHEAFLAALRRVAERQPAWCARTTIFDPESLAAFNAKCSGRDMSYAIQMSNGGEAYRARLGDAQVPSRFLPIEPDMALRLLGDLAQEGEPAPLHCFEQSAPPPC